MLVWEGLYAPDACKPYCRMADARTGVLTIPKVASSSIQQTLGKTWGKDLTKDSQPERVYAFIRDPMDRLRSAYQFFTQKQAHRFYMPWESFVDGVLQGDPNGHWQRQAWFLHELTSPQLYRFERIADVWQEISDVPLKHINSSEPMELSDYRMNELQEWYREDYELRARCG